MSTYYHKVLSDSDIDGKSVKHTIKFIKVVASSKMLSTIHQKKKTAPGVAAPRTVIRGSKLRSLLPSNHNKCRRKKQSQEKLIPAPHQAQAASGSVLTVDGKRA